MGPWLLLGPAAQGATDQAKDRLQPGPWAWWLRAQSAEETTKLGSGWSHLPARTPKALPGLPAFPTGLSLPKPDVRL